MIHTVFRVYYLLIIARVLMSWIRLGDNFLTRFIYEMTEPVLGIFRRIFPPRPGFSLDISPIFAIIALQLIETLIRSLI
ncbi:MAG: YggT family protein [Firmicutes bacterium]|nr:YggT family protein [Bacillota bacterium]